MMDTSRRRYSLVERRELWQRWQQGETISEIGRALHPTPGTIHAVLCQRGGAVAPHRSRRGLLR